MELEDAIAADGDYEELVALAEAEWCLWWLFPLALSNVAVAAAADYGCDIAKAVAGRAACSPAGGQLARALVA